MAISKKVSVGEITIGGGYPTVIQTMVNTTTADIEKTVAQCISVWQAGAQLVRITIPTIKDLEAVKKIQQQLKEQGFGNIPLVADIHFSPKIALKAAEIVDKVRINPGNFAEQKGLSETEQANYIQKKLIPLVTLAKQRKIALRIGVNHGSLSERMLERYGDTPEGMVASAMEYIRHLETLSFFSIIISLKSSNPIVMVQANRLLVQEMENTKYRYPIHLGVTEAGDGQDGRIKSAIGIGTLLAEGIGDTIRVSLTEPPENEIPTAKKIIAVSEKLQYHNAQGNTAYHLRKTLSINGKVGGQNKPIVILPYDKSYLDSDLLPDFIVSDTIVDLPENTSLIMPWQYCEKNKSTIPLLNLEIYKNRWQQFADYPLVFLQLTTEQALNISNLPSNISLIVDLNTSNNGYQIQPLIIQYLDTKKILNPVVWRYTANENDEEAFLIQSAILLGRGFMDGYGNGLFLDNHSTAISKTTVNSVAFGILQATRRRITKTEYIACPSCGRTLFNLEDTVAKIRRKTTHLKGIKIAVMGCIVNGIGEMADADYGYVGASSGKITLYKNKVVVQKNIDETEAVEALIRLIKDSGDWKEHF